MKVVNQKTDKYTEYIGRGSIFGNPFKIPKHGSRTTVIRRFEAYARKNKRLMAAISKLPENAVLGCYCAPKACHGDVIIKLWKEIHENPLSS